MKRQTVLLVALFGLLALAILPALAEEGTIEPTKVQGDASCASVGSTGDLSLKIEPVEDETYAGPGGVSITIELDPELANTFDFAMDGGLVHDVIVKGSAANHYDYTAFEGPTSSSFESGSLTIPNGNRLNYAIFCYQFEGQELQCGGSVSTDGEDADASFTRVDDSDCDPEDGKFAFLDVESGDESLGDETIVFIPRGSGVSAYDGELTLTKAFDDPNLLVLQYDPDADGPEGFREVPACEDVDEGGVEIEAFSVESATIPEGDTWCFYEVAAEPIGDGFWTVRWLIFGMEDPKFR